MSTTDRAIRHAITVRPLAGRPGIISTGSTVRFRPAADGTGMLVSDGVNVARVAQHELDTAVRNDVADILANPVVTPVATGRTANDWCRDAGRDRATLTLQDVASGDVYAGENILGGCRSVAEAVRVAGLDWQVTSEPFTTQSGAASGDLRAIVRTDRREVLQVRSDGFAIAQNAERFAPLQPLVNAGAKIRGAGSFRGGRTVFMQVDLGAHEVIPGDFVQMFAHVRDTHDGSLCWTLQVGSWRIVCANTLLHACESGQMLAKSRHGASFRTNLDDAARALESLKGSALAKVESYRALATWQMTDADRRAFLGALFPRPAETKDNRREMTAWERQCDEVMAHITLKQRGALDIDNVLGTGWAALNGVTDYVDHILAAARSGSEMVTFRRAFEGTHAETKATAFDWLSAHAPTVARA